MKVVGKDPPGVARVLRAQRNAAVNVMPFLVLGLLYVINGASVRAAWLIIGSFTLARIGHTFAYLMGKQPWRTALFIIGGLGSIGRVM